MLSSKKIVEEYINKSDWKYMKILILHIVLGD